MHKQEGQQALFAIVRRYAWWRAAACCLRVWINKSDHP